jgi:hypothetical protein
MTGRERILFHCQLTCQSCAKGDFCGGLSYPYTSWSVCLPALLSILELVRLLAKAYKKKEWARSWGWPGIGSLCILPPILTPSLCPLFEHTPFSPAHLPVEPNGARQPKTGLHITELNHSSPAGL